MATDEAAQKRFVFLLTVLARGGTLSVLRHFWNSLERHGSVLVIANAPETAGTQVAVRDVRGPLSSPMRFPGVWVYAVRMMAAAHRAIREQPRTVLLPQDSLATGAAAAVVGRLTRTPCVLMEHGGAAVIRTPFFWRERIPARTMPERLVRPLLVASIRLLHWLSLRLADAALVPSQESEGIFRAAGFRAERIFRYHVPVDLDRFTPASDEERGSLRAGLGLPADRLVVGTIARLAPEKGLDTLVRAVRELPSEWNPLLVIGGDGRLRTLLETLAADCGIDAFFTGGLPDGRIPPLLRSLDVFVYASRQGTNVPNVTLEAMACGLAIVATDQPPIHHEMLGEARGIVIRPDDPPTMAKAIARYLGEPNARRTAGAAARAYVERHHAPEVLDRELDAFAAWATTRMPR